tara:strand:- start:1221 stop:1448 length:228 start_codon:yes stop_codon:yes gene_type:complete
MNKHLIRTYIRLFLERKKNVLGEPDLTNDETRKKEKEKNPKEASVAAGMPGVSTPLGTGSNYPAKVIKRTKKNKK